MGFETFMGILTFCGLMVALAAGRLWGLTDGFDKGWEAHKRFCEQRGE